MEGMLMEGRDQHRQTNEEICIHVIGETEDINVQEGDDLHFRFDIAPFRQTFFRYSMYGRSEVVQSSAFVYASHHSSTWLDIPKLSVALVGNNEIPNLTLFSPTVKEIYFMGHIKFPATAFKLMLQLHTLEKVVFNTGFGGYINEFNETPAELATILPEVPTVTSLEITMNHQLYRTCTEGMRGTFNRIMQSIIKHSFDSFPNLTCLSVDIPNMPVLLAGVTTLMGRDNLRQSFEMKTGEKIKVSRIQQVVQPPMSLPFDPCARFPTYSQYNNLRRIEAYGFNYNNNYY